MSGHDGRRATCLILLILVQTSISAASENLVTDHIESDLTRPDHVVFSGPGMFSETDIDSTSGLIRGPLGHLTHWNDKIGTRMNFLTGMDMGLDHCSISDV